MDQIILGLITVTGSPPKGVTMGWKSEAFQSLITMGQSSHFFKIMNEKQNAHQ